jgi:hypothetical protein
MRNKKQVQRKLEQIDATLKNLERKFAQSEFFPYVENQFVQLSEYLSDAIELVDVEDEDIENRYIA